MEILEIVKCGGHAHHPLGRLVSTTAGRFIRIALNREKRARDGTSIYQVRRFNRADDDLLQGRKKGSGFTLMGRGLQDELETIINNELTLSMQKGILKLPTRLQCWGCTWIGHVS